MLPGVLGAVFALAFAACDPDSGPRTKLLADYEISADVHPFSAGYLGHCAGSQRNSVVPGVFRTRAGRLYFQGTTDGDDAGLWSSDGTAAGTRRMVESDAYASGAETRFVGELLPGEDGVAFAMDHACFFPNPPPSHVAPLWWSDARGAARLLLAGYDARDLVAAGERVFFHAAGADGWTGLWTLAPTSHEPVELWRFAAVSGAVAVGQGVFFGARTGVSWDLWSSDGSADGTRPLARGCLPQNLIGVGRRAYFVCGRELWTSDGSAETTAPVSGAPRGAIGIYIALVELNGRLAFLYRPAALETTVELWLSDGTAAGTQRLATLALPAGMSLGVPALSMGGFLYFTAGDDLWRSDGTPAGTRVVATLPPHAPKSFAFPGGRFLARLDDTLVIAMNDADVWRYDGRAAERVPVSAGVGFIDELAVAPSLLYYAAACNGCGGLLSLRGLHFVER